MKAEIGQIHNAEERSEKEHKELIVTANKGLEAIDKLSEKYADVTQWEHPEGWKDPFIKTDGESSSRVGTK